MKITIDDKQFELVPVPPAGMLGETTYTLKPVKKSERKDTYFITFFKEFGITGEYLLKLDLELTPTTANKLSEAISALVEWMQDPKSRKDYDGETPIPENIFFIKAAEAKQSFQESQ
jgi:hypothetical protein